MKTYTLIDGDNSVCYNDLTALRFERLRHCGGFLWKGEE